MFSLIGGVPSVSPHTPLPPLLSATTGATLKLYREKGQQMVRSGSVLQRGALTKPLSCAAHSERDIFVHANESYQVRDVAASRANAVRSLLSSLPLEMAFPCS